MKITQHFLSWAVIKYRIPLCSSFPLIKDTCKWTQKRSNKH